MAKKQYLICEPDKPNNAEWFALGTKEEIEDILLDIVRDTTDPITDIKIFEIIPVDFHLKVVLQPKVAK